MRNHIRHADLVARALGALEGPLRKDVDDAIASAPDVKRRFDEVASHLLLYDRLPDAPPAPAFDRIETALATTADEDEDARTGYEAQAAAPADTLRWAAPAALAAAAVVMIGLFVSGVFEPSVAPKRAAITVGAGIVRDGSVVSAAGPAELRVGARVRIVLDGGARIAVESEERVTLMAGRAYFEVQPGAFAVATSYGDVEVLGTAFEVDVRNDELGVGVAEGSVRAAGNVLEAGTRLAAGRVEPATNGHRPGLWFQQPRVTLRQARPGAVAVGERARLILTIENPGFVELRAPIKAGTSAVFIDFTHPDGSEGGTAVLAGNVVSGGNLPQPGEAVILGPRKALPFTVELDSPFTQPGLWRCKALFHSAKGRIVSPEIEIEVR